MTTPVISGGVTDKVRSPFADDTIPMGDYSRVAQNILLYFPAATSNRQFPAARITLLKALQLGETLTVPHLFLGILDFREGQLAQAAKELETFNADKPNEPTAHLWLGYILAAQNDPAAASLQFKQVLQEDPYNLDADYALGKAALSLANRNALAMQSLDPSQADVLKLAAGRFQMMGDLKEAEAATTEANRRLLIAPAQTGAAATQLAALDTQIQEEQEQAFEAFAAILNFAPDSYRAHEVRGDAFVEAQQQPEALAQYQEVIRLNPQLPGIHETLSICLMTAGRFADALAALESELKLSPAAAARLQTRIGQTLLAMGDNAAAEQALELAIQHPHVPPQALLLLAQVRLRQDQPADAIPLLRKYVIAEPDSSTAFYYLSRAFRILGDQANRAHALAKYNRISRDARARTLAGTVTHGTSVESFAEVVPATDLATDEGPK